MQTFESAKTPDPEQGTLHVALLDGDGTVIFHEELPAAEAPARHHMFMLQAELEVRDIPDAKRSVHMGPAWPPEGYQVKKGKVVALPVEAA